MSNILKIQVYLNYLFPIKLVAIVSLHPPSNNNLFAPLHPDVIIIPPQLVSALDNTC